MKSSQLGGATGVLLAMTWLAMPGIAAAAPVRVDRLGSTTPSDASVSFPTTAVGQTSAFCIGICFSQTTSPPNSCDASGTWTLDHNVSAPFVADNYTIGSPTKGCTGGTSTSLPATTSAGQALWFDLRFTPTSNGHFSDTLTLSGINFDLSGSTPGSGSGCTPDATTLCIDQNPGDSRFKIKVSYHTAEGGGLSGSGNAVSLNPVGVTEGGLFWFFQSTNPEMLIKVIDACGLNSHFWVFFAATTNVGFTVTVTDTQTGHQASYTNPDLRAAPPVQDTSALTCP